MAAPLDDRRVLLTGATGFLGRHVADAFAARGADLFALVRPSSDLETLPGSIPAGQIVVADTNTEQVVNAVSAVRPDLVVHCAGRVLTDHTDGDVDDLVASNVLLFAALLQGMASQGAIRMVNVGTYLEHGPSGDIRPNSLYAALKRAALELVKYYVSRVPTRIITIKPSVIYGPGDPRPRLVRALVSAAMENRPLKLSPGYQQIDLIHVSDVAAALLTAAQRLETAEPPVVEEYFAVTGHSRTLREIVGIISGIVGKDIPVTWGAVPYKQTEVMAPFVRGPVQADWKPGVSLEQGIRQMMADLASRHPDPPPA